MRQGSCGFCAVVRLWAVRLVRLTPLAHLVQITFPVSIKNGEESNVQPTGQEHARACMPYQPEKAVCFLL